jgi:DNA-binding transcriptional LysR family regulator
LSKIEYVSFDTQEVWMELRHLRYFQAVASEMNFTRAAERLHMAQPPLSRQIRELEEELGVQLFDRSGRALKITEAGRFLNEQSLQLMARLQEITESTKKIGNNEKQWFGIGFVPSTLYGFIPEIIRAMRALDAKVEIGLSELITTQQLEALKAGRIDIGFGRIVLDDPAIVRTVLLEEPLVAVLPVDHVLSQKEALSLDDLDGHPFVLYPGRPRPSFADHVMGLFRAHGRSLRVVHEANELQTAIGLVASGLGMTLVPASVRGLRRDDIAYRPLNAPGFISPVIMSYRADDQSPFLRKVIDLVQSVTAASVRD